MAVNCNWSKHTIKLKPKVYRGVQSYLIEDQISILSRNPDIVKVTPRQVHYTQTYSTASLSKALY